jgi:hypothetical protein
VQTCAARVAMEIRTKSRRSLTYIVPFNLCGNLDRIGLVTSSRVALMYSYLLFFVWPPPNSSLPLRRN